MSDLSKRMRPRVAPAPAKRAAEAFRSPSDDMRRVTVYLVREDEAAEVKRLAEAVLSGASLRGLARDLRQRGVPNAAGRVRWTNKDVAS